MTEPPPTKEPSPEQALGRTRTLLGRTLGLSVAGYLAYAMWHGLSETTAEISAFAWWVYPPVLALTFINYGLRFVKWAYLLRTLGIDMPHRANAWAFLAGLGMVITPGKAGELVKPWVVREVTGTPMARTIPALVTERLTDGIAVILLTALGVSTFYPENVVVVGGSLLLTFGLILAVSVEPVGALGLSLVGVIPVVGRLEPKLREAYTSLRTCLSPIPLVITILLSLAAWWAECIGMWLVFLGLGIPAGLDVSTFLYAFATVFGAPSPGGLGMAEIALVETSVRLIDGLSEPAALAAALLIRVGTLWIGVLMGAFAILRLDAVLADASVPDPQSP